MITNTSFKKKTPLSVWLIQSMRKRDIPKRLTGFPRRVVSKGGDQCKGTVTPSTLHIPFFMAQRLPQFEEMYYPDCIQTE